MQIRTGNLLDARQRTAFDRTEFGEIENWHIQHLQTVAACRASGLRQGCFDEQLHVVFGDTALFTASFDLTDIDA